MIIGINLLKRFSPVNSQKEDANMYNTKVTVNSEERKF